MKNKKWNESVLKKVDDTKEQYSHTKMSLFEGENRQNIGYLSFWFHSVLERDPSIKYVNNPVL